MKYARQTRHDHSLHVAYTLREQEANPNSLWSEQSRPLPWRYDSFAAWQFVTEVCDRKLTALLDKVNTADNEATVEYHHQSARKHSRPLTSRRIGIILRVTRDTMLVLRLFVGGTKHSIAMLLLAKEDDCWWVEVGKASTD